MAQRTYACIDPECKVLIERQDEAWSSAVRLILNHQQNVKLTPEMMLGIIGTLTYAYHGHTGNWPSIASDGRVKVLDAAEHDRLYLESCKKELDKRDVIPPVVSPPVARVRVRLPQPIATPAALPTPPVRVRRRD